MSSHILKYVADGLAMESHLYLPRDVSSPCPGVLVFPEAFGLEDHAKRRAQRLADVGFVALACDLHGQGRLLNSLDEVMGVLGSLLADPLRIRARARGGLEALEARPEVDASRIAAIGYCFGGTMSLELARGGADIRGVVGFHSGLTTARPQDARNIKAKVIVCIGADDPLVSAEQRAAFQAEMRDGGVDWQLHTYGGAVHSFTNPAVDAMGNPALRYCAAADARSWATMVSFFGEIF